jgi:hypothetical protein
VNDHLNDIPEAILLEFDFGFVGTLKEPRFRGSRTASSKARPIPKKLSACLGGLRCPEGQGPGDKKRGPKRVSALAFDALRAVD